MNAQDAQILLNEIAKNKYVPNEWELDFINAMDEKTIKGEFISENMSFKLQQIYRKSQGSYI